MYIIHKYAYFSSCYIFHIKCLQVQFISLTYHHYDDLQTILKIRPTEKKKCDDAKTMYCFQVTYVVSIINSFNLTANKMDLLKKQTTGKNLSIYQSIENDLKTTATHNGIQTTNDNRGIQERMLFSKTFESMKQKRKEKQKVFVSLSH